MIDFIYLVQNYLLAEGLNINTLMALFCALIAIILFCYLLRAKKNEYNRI